MDGDELDSEHTLPLRSKGHQDSRMEESSPSTPREQVLGEEAYAQKLLRSLEKRVARDRGVEFKCFKAVASSPESKRMASAKELRAETLVIQATREINETNNNQDQLYEQYASLTSLNQAIADVKIDDDSLLRKPYSPTVSLPISTFTLGERMRDLK
jgi:hypothetical protein